MRSYLRIDITDNCNIRCIMCQAYNSTKMSSTNFLDFNTFKKQTKGQLKEWGTIQIGNTAEPLIHPQFVDFLKYIRDESDAIIHVVTNGKLLDRYAEVLNETRCLVQISIDSIVKETHEYIRAGSNFDRLLHNLSLLDTNKAQVLLSFTMMSSNIVEYEEMLEFCKKRNYKIGAFPMVLRDFYGIIPLNLIEESLWFNKQKLKDWLKKFYGKDYDNIVRGSASGATNLHPNEINCDAHIKDLIIDAKGNTTLCYKIPLPNLYQMPLEQIWNSPAAEAFREKVDKGRGPCIKCDYRQRCLAPSMSLLENHFSERIASALSDEAKQLLRFDTALSNSEQKQIFIKDISKKFVVFSIYKNGNKFYSCRISDCEGMLDAETQVDLYEKIMNCFNNPFAPPRLLETINGYNIVSYKNKYWAAPLSLGHLDLTIQSSIEKPGIICCDTIKDLKKRVSLEEKKNTFWSNIRNYLVPAKKINNLSAPRLLKTIDDYNIVSYKNKYWAAPLSLGHLDLTIQSNREKPGIFCCDAIEDLEKWISSGIKKN